MKNVLTLLLSSCKGGGERIKDLGGEKEKK